MDGKHVPAHVQVQLLIVQNPLGLFADTAHRVHRGLGELAVGCLTGEHDDISAIQDGVQDVGGLRARWAGSSFHGVQHLRGRHHELARQVALSDDHLLHQPHLLDVDFHAHVASGYHDAIACLDDLVDVVDALLILDFGDDLDGAAANAQGVPDELHVTRILHEGGGDEVHTLRNAKLHQVLDVLLLQHRELHLHARQVHVLLLADGDVVQHLNDNVVTPAALHPQRERAVGGQNDLAGFHCRRQGRVRDGQDLLVALEAVVRH
mmetsp:Transcript_83454/g.150549  ORF Transcript_83454/g.150549 Transcript_83454/m.150549 type:complete len:264 (-) Transcript_83454:451-1242(-)